ncbi:unnamed protein product [Caenorhabditis bovis]|uniref:Uncharacterized protein n=1 Tax=Caenorhabditis bovis TaxID=2654633 RepID=A0A8S1F5R8_9PELO|nr:unnamed protein product [Caenorhabditis bovis]
MRFYLVLLVSLNLCIAQFNIPLPFGNIVLNKNEKGDLEIGGGQSLNLFGWGGSRDFKLTSGNGTFKIDKTDKVLVNGTTFGGDGSFGIDEKRGIDVGQNVTIGNQTLIGGPGKESNFLEGLINLFKPQH